MRKWLAIAMLIIGLDQASKLAIEHFMQFGQTIPVLPGFNLVLTYNPGAAFSFLADAGGWQRHFFTVLAIVVSGVLTWQLKKNPAPSLQSWSMTLILGGAIGNVIDRIYLGHVIDFIQVYYKVHYWPAFNIADSAITVGAVLMVLDSLRNTASKQGEPKEN